MLDLESNQNFCVYRLALDPGVPYGARVLMVSPSIRQLAGIEKIDNFAAWFERIHPDDEQRVLEGNRRALEQHKPYDEVVRVWHPGKQRWVWLHTVSTPIYGPDGVPTHYNGLIVDISEQKQAEERLQYKIQFEDLITAISTQFINLPSERIDEGIQRALQSIGKFAGVDRSYVFLFAPDSETMDNTHEWCAAGIEPQAPRLQNVPVRAFDWFSRQLLAGETVHIPRIMDLSPEAVAEKAEFAAQGIRSMIAVPISYQGRVMGFLGFDSVQAEKTWDEEAIRLLTMVGEIIVNALEHKRAQQAINQAYQLLEQRVEERTHELSTLLEVSHNLTSILDLSPLLGLILDQLRAVVDYTGAAILSVEGGRASVQAYRGPIDRETMLQKSFAEDDPLYRQVIGSREAVIIADAQDLAGNPGGAPCATPARLQDLFDGSHAWMGVPLIIQERVVGLLAVDHTHPGFYTGDHGRLAMAFASQAAVAIENARLYTEEQQQRSELEALYRADEQLYRHLHLNEVLEALVDIAVDILKADKSTLLVWDAPHRRLTPGAARGFKPETLQALSLTDEDSLAGKVINFGQALFVQDARNEPGVAGEIIEDEGIRSFVHVPIKIGGSIFGIFNANYLHPRAFSEEDRRLFAALAQRAALAIENAHLYHEEQRRSREIERRRQVAEGLRSLLEVLNSDRPVGEILYYAVMQAAQLIGSDASILRHADPQQGIVTTDASFNIPLDFDAIRVTRLYYSSGDYRLMAHQPIVIPDLHAEFAPALAPDSPFDDIQRAGIQAELKHYRSSLAVPVFIREEIYGALRFYFKQPVEFSDEDIRLAMTLGDQVALAIENDRLRAHLQENAAAAERNRLARDLHDAVTQTLFSASLIAEVLPKLWERQPEEGRRRLEELRQLTRGALAEMRTLLLELRPTALTEAPLDDLLRQLVEAFTGRTRLPATLEVEGRCDLPTGVRVALYRIAQEALNNIAKHSKARRAQVALSCEPGKVRLLVSDDGQGFDPDSVSSEHLGLSIIKERAEGIDARLEITSRAGQGTQVRLYWQEPEEGDKRQS